MQWLLIALGVLANAAASVLAKLAPPLEPERGLVHLLENWRLLLAVACYGVAFLVYTAALQRLPLNIAHPVSTAGAIVLVGLCSALLFDEPFDLARIVGYLLLFAGICALLYSGTRGAE